MPLAAAAHGQSLSRDSSDLSPASVPEAGGVRAGGLSSCSASARARSVCYYVLRSTSRACSLADYKKGSEIDCLPLARSCRLMRFAPLFTGRLFPSLSLERFRSSSWGSCITGGTANFRLQWLRASLFFSARGQGVFAQRARPIFRRLARTELYRRSTVHASRGHRGRKPRLSKWIMP